MKPYFKPYTIFLSKQSCQCLKYISYDTCWIKPCFSLQIVMNYQIKHFAQNGKYVSNKALPPNSGNVIKGTNIIQFQNVKNSFMLEPLVLWAAQHIALLHNRRPEFDSRLEVLCRSRIPPSSS